MAKKTSKVQSKAGAVREYLAEHPDAAAKDVVAALAEKKVVIDVQTVYVTKNAMRKAGQLPAAKGKRRGRKAGTSRRAAAGKTRRQPAARQPGLEKRVALTEDILVEAANFLHNHQCTTEELRLACDVIDRLQMPG